MNKVLALILLIGLSGCKIGSHANSQKAEFPALASAQVPVRNALPSPIAPAAPDKRAEVVPLPADTEVDSTASNNAVQQSATGAVNAQIAKLAESVDASLMKLDSKIVAQNEMSADLRNDMRAQATAIAELKLKLDANVQGQAGLSNRIEQVTTTIGRDSVTQFSEGMERFMTRMLEVVQYMASAIRWIVGGAVLSCVGMIGSNLKVCVDLIKFLERSRSKDDERQDKILRDVVLKGGAK